MGAAASVSMGDEDPSSVELSYHAARRLAGPWWDADAWRTSPKTAAGNITLAQLQAIPVKFDSTYIKIRRRHCHHM